MIDEFIGDALAGQMAQQDHHQKQVLSSAHGGIRPCRLIFLIRINGMADRCIIKAHLRDELPLKPSPFNPDRAP